MKNTHSLTSIKSLRNIASEYTAEQIELCINEQISTKSNNCNLHGDESDIINALARASVIRQLTDDGASLNHASRELGRRMRSLNQLVK